MRGITERDHMGYMITVSYDGRAVTFGEIDSKVYIDLDQTRQLAKEYQKQADRNGEKKVYGIAAIVSLEHPAKKPKGHSVVWPEGGPTGRA